MTEKTKKKDFVELDFSAYANGVLFDTTIASEAKKAGIDTNKGKFESLVICIGEGMLLKGFDKALEDKEIGKDYDVVLKPEEAFGKRDPKLIKTIPLSAFSEIPHAGMLVNVNGFVAKVVSVTSGRTLVDLNNPLMGKEIKYTFKIRGIVSDVKKKIEAIARVFRIDVGGLEEKENKWLVAAKNQKNLNKNDIELFKKKVKEILGKDIEFK